MKKYIIIKFYILFCAQFANAQIEMDMPIDTNHLVYDFYYPPNDCTIVTQGNGSFINSRATITATDMPDVHVHPEGYPQSEPHLSINRHHPNNIIISANYYNGSLVSPPTINAYNQSIYVNNDFNRNTSTNPWDFFLNFPNVTGRVRGDPSTAFDKDGNAFVSTLNNDLIGNRPRNFLLDASADLGVSWPSPAQSGNIVSTMDKPMIASDYLPYSPYANHLYCAFTNLFKVFNQIPPDRAQINVTRSDDGGASFYPNVVLDPNHLSLGTSICTGKQGEVYVCWGDWLAGGDAAGVISGPAHKIGFARAYDGGATFDPVIHIPQIGDLNGLGNDTHAEFGNTDVNDFPVIAVDKSCGPYSGRIYIAYNINLNPTGITSHIRVIYSDDDGTNWNYCEPTAYGIVDNDGVQNWMPTIAVDDANGNVCVAYLFTNNYATDPDILTDTYLAYSDDGGLHFSNIRVSDMKQKREPINPAIFRTNYCGDYIAVDAYGGRAYVAWNDGRNTPPGQLNQTWNIYCSTVVFSNPLTFSSQQDMNLNGPINWTNVQHSILYEAVNSITSPLQPEPFICDVSSNVTFKAGNNIHFKNGFGAKNGSSVHAHIDAVASCTTPFRLSVPELILDNLAETSLQINTYPNPFSTSTDIKYTLAKTENLSISLFDSYGKKIMQMVNNIVTEKGKYIMKINGYTLTAGVYFLNFTTLSQTTVKKIIKL